MKKVALTIAMASLTLAQTPDFEKKAEFEVASIKPTSESCYRGRLSRMRCEHW
jgi:hypothetical protein